MDREEIVVLVIIALFGCGATALSTNKIAELKWQKQIIEHGAAYYHPETGEFTWREKPEESE